MKFFHFFKQGRVGTGAVLVSGLAGWLEDDEQYPGTIDHLVREGPQALALAHESLLNAPRLSEPVTFLPPLTQSQKIICVGLNYRDHSAESGYKQPEHPTLFARFTSSLIAHGAPLMRPVASDTLDYEGELVAVIGKAGRHVPLEQALEHVIGYSIFNDGSVREYQHLTPQWTLGKNFDGTGAFGPYFVTADELPPGGRGLMLRTRLNGETVQSASTDDLVFDVATLVSTVSEAMTLQPGDLIVTGTPSGVGHARSPRLYMRPGDVCEVEIDGIGVLRNHIHGEAVAA